MRQKDRIRAKGEILAKGNDAMGEIEEFARKNESYSKRLLGLLGKEVEVKVDGPLGSAHPKYPDSTYPVNYGFIESMRAPDGDFQDAYILGVDEPVSSFTGTVIAIIRRLDDVEDKLVVAPKGVSYRDEEILAKLHFQGRYFRSVLIR